MSRTDCKNLWGWPISSASCHLKIRPGSTSRYARLSHHKDWMSSTRGCIGGSAAPAAALSSPRPRQQSQGGLQDLFFVALLIFNVPNCINLSCCGVHIHKNPSLQGLKKRRKTKTQHWRSHEKIAPNCLRWSQRLPCQFDERVSFYNIWKWIIFWKTILKTASPLRKRIQKNVQEHGQELSRIKTKLGMWCLQP